MAKATSRLRKGLQLNDPDILQAEEATFLSVDGCSERASLSQWWKNWLNWSIKENWVMVEKLNVILENVKKHDSTLFQSSGRLALKQGEKFTHSFNVKQLSWRWSRAQDVEAVKNNYDSIFKSILLKKTLGVIQSFTPTLLCSVTSL